MVEEIGEILGRFNLVDVADGTAELGFRLAEKATGRDLATRTIRQLLTLCATTYALNDAPGSGHAHEQGIPGFPPRMGRRK